MTLLPVKLTTLSGRDQVQSFLMRQLLTTGLDNSVAFVCLARRKITSFLNEKRLPDIIAAAFIILGWLFLLMNTKTTILSRHVSWRELVLGAFLVFCSSGNTTASDLFREALGETDHCPHGQWSSCRLFQFQQHESKPLKIELLLTFRKNNSVYSKIY